MMQTNLELVFTLIISSLVHNTQLNAKSIFDDISNSRVRSVSVEYFNGIILANISLTINEYFVVKGNIYGLFL